MEGLVEQLAVSCNLTGEWGFALISLLAMLAAAVVLLTFASLVAGVLSWIERRIAGRMQSRIGPNRVGPHGYIQWLADGLKNFLKEDLVPRDADEPLFRLAPYLCFTAMFAVFVCLPFSQGLIAADLNIGLFYILAISSLEVLGIMMAGWASNSKWSFYGGMRSAAQIVSYEIPVGMAALSVVLLGGTLSMQEIVARQGWNPLYWNFFHSPFLFAAFVIFFAGQVAEINRTPFDLPEAESELVSGFNTEYSGMRFLMFFFAEWANIWVISAIAVVLFFGGWQVPWPNDLPLFGADLGLYDIAPALAVLILVGGALGVGYLGVRFVGWYKNPRKKTGDRDLAALIGGLLFLGLALGAAALAVYGLVNIFDEDGLGAWGAGAALNFVQLCSFLFKTTFLVFIVVQLRWTLPRLRVDQLMGVCWKYLTPIAFVSILGTAFWMVTVDRAPALFSIMDFEVLPTLVVRLVMFLLSALIVGLYFKKAFFDNRRKAGAPVDLDFWK